MRVPVSWLRSYCDPGLSAQEIANALTMAGVKLERLHRVGVGDPAEFVVGKVLESERHPNADRLTVCRVDVGNEEPQTIVCGAPNVAGGQTVAVALPGAIMPDGTKLGEAKLRGVRSAGMILAEDEVGIGEDHDGIMVLEAKHPVGAPLFEHLPIHDESHVRNAMAASTRPISRPIRRRNPRGRRSWPPRSATRSTSTRMPTSRSRPRGAPPGR